MRPPEIGDRFAKAASALVGCPFKLYGRNPETGLDCVGLVAASLEAIGKNASTPRVYTLRNSSIDRWQSCFAKSGFGPAEGNLRPGDLLVTCPSVLQHHLMIVETPSRVIHAHAGLRRVVRQPLSNDIEIAAHWRLSQPG